MPYFSYHATVKKLLREGKLAGFYFAEEYRGISPALVLLFDDPRHPVMPIREARFDEYLPLLHAAQSKATERSRENPAPPQKRS